MRSAIVIPARFHSVRLPQKPLALIRGKTLIQRVYERCIAARAADVFVATDHEDILNHVESFGGKAIITSPALASGTDRVAAAYKTFIEAYDVIVNVQGDEPLVPPEVITSLLKEMSFAAVGAATPVTPLTDPKELSDPNIVKVTIDGRGDALYFSRSIIPFNRDKQAENPETWLSEYPYQKHIGIYAYRPFVLEMFTKLGESALERSERLEQLRLLEAGVKIRCVSVDYDSVAVDVESDIAKVEAILTKNNWD